MKWLAFPFALTALISAAMANIQTITGPATSKSILEYTGVIDTSYARSRPDVGMRARAAGCRRQHGILGQNAVSVRHRQPTSYNYWSYDRQGTKSYIIDWRAC